MMPIGHLESYASHLMDKFKMAQTIQKEPSVKNRVMLSTTSMRIGSQIGLLVCAIMTAEIVDLIIEKSTLVLLR